MVGKDFRHWLAPVNARVPLPRPVFPQGALYHSNMAAFLSRYAKAQTGFRG
jgi:hypothetical protein